MKYKVESGIYNLDFELSQLEKKLFIEFEDRLDSKGFRYLSIPSLTRWDSFERQDIEDIVKSLSVDHIHNLSGSAEQGILQYFSDSMVEPQLIYSKNQCFRHENYDYEGLKRCKEFVKLIVVVILVKSKVKGITGATHTISNTGIASPRILIPFIEMV